MNIAIIGSGYVGLITGLCLSQIGNQVRCIDVNEKIVKNLNLGNLHFFEEGLKDLLRNELDSGRFKASRNLESLNLELDLIIIAVGTPSDLNGDINLNYIKSASKDIGKYIKNSENFISVVVKSTVLPCTTDTLVKEIIATESSKVIGEFGLGMNPEFLREGSAIKDFMNPDRIVIGTEDARTKSQLRNLYSSWDCEKIFVNCRTAELIKYTNNCFLALQISTSNEIANLAYEIGDIDIEDVMRGVHLDKRWNPIENGKRTNPGILKYLEAGCGFGGSCFPKDVKALKHLGIKRRLNMPILKSIIEVNDKQHLKIIENIENIEGFKKFKILILGLSFKEGTDDIRESPAIKIVRNLKKKVTKIYAHDPMAIDNFKATISQTKVLEYVFNWESKIRLCDAIIVLTNWPIYKKLEQHNIEDKLLFDPRRIYKKDLIKVKKYFSIGLRDLKKL